MPLTIDDARQNGWVWVFNGEDGSFPSGVFTSREAAEAWIAKYALTGVLTAYPLDVGVYDWAVEEGYFGREKAVTDFVGRFSSAYQPHHHYEEGRRPT